jgi:hypothetical protein
MANTSDLKHGEFGPPLPGESLSEYVMRVGAHPDLGDLRVDTPEEIEKALDITEQMLGGGFILTGADLPTPSAHGTAKA